MPAQKRATCLQNQVGLAEREELCWGEGQCPKEDKARGGRWASCASLHVCLVGNQGDIQDQSRRLGKIKSDREGREGQREMPFPRPPESQLDTMSTRFDGVHMSSTLSRTTSSCDMAQQKTTRLSRGQRQDSWAAAQAQDRCSQQPVFSITLQLNLLRHPQPACLDWHPMNLCGPAVLLLARAGSPGLKPCSAAASCPLFLGLPFCRARWKGKQASAAG